MLKRNIVANFLGQGWASIMGLAFIPIYIKFLGIEAYGLIGLFAVLQAWMSLFDVGVGATIGREMARFTAGEHSPKAIRDLLRTLECLVFTLALLIAGVIGFGADWLAADWLVVEKLPIDEVSRAISIIALLVGLRVVEGIYRSAIMGLQRQVWLNGAHAALSTLRYGGVIAVLVFVSPTISAFFLWQAVISIVSVLVYATKLYQFLPKAAGRAHFSHSALMGVLGFASGVLGVNVLSVVLTQLDKVLLSRLLSLESFGYYMLATVVAASLSIVIGPITQALYPRMVELVSAQDDRGFAEVYHLGAQLVSLISVSIMPVLFFFPEGALYLWSGDMPLAKEVAPIMAPLVLGSFLNGLMWMPYQSQLATGWTRLSLVVNFCAVCFLVPMILWLVPIYGAIAAAWSWVVLNMAYILILVHFMHQRILPAEKYQWYRSDVCAPAGGAFLVLLIFKYVLSPDMETMGRVTWCLYLSLVALAVFATAVRLCDRVWPEVLERVSENRYVSHFVRKTRR